MTAADTPDQMTWRFDGYQFVLDEDGLNLRLNGSRGGFEQAEVVQLIERYQAIREAAAVGFNAPVPPTREQIRAMGGTYAERRAIEDAIRGLRAQLATDFPDLPF